jgi:hypothetical protein
MASKIVIYLILIVCNYKASAQCNLEEFKGRIINDSVKFKTLKTGGTYVKNDRLIPSEIKVEIVSPSIKYVGQCDSGSLIRSLIPLLNNKSKDWCAILLLYSLSGKDASQFVGINSKHQWRRFYKKKDIDYWQKYLMVK